MFRIHSHRLLAKIARAPLACCSLRPISHGHFGVPAQASFPRRLLRRLLRRRALIIFANNKELTAKDFILRT